GLERLANARLAALSTFEADGHLVRSLLLLAFFAGDVLAHITHTLALVGLGGTPTADVGGHLAHLLLVGARDGDFRLGRCRNRDPRRSLEQHFVAEAERELQILALHGGAVTDALDLQLLLEARIDADHHIVDQRAGRPPGSTGFPAVI